MGGLLVPSYRGGGGGGSAEFLQSSISGFDDIDYFNAVHGSAGLDYDFAREDETTPPDGWEWLNQDAALYVEHYGYGRIDWGGGGDVSNWHCLMTDLPVASSYEIYMHLWGQTSGPGNYIGLVLEDEVSGELVANEMWVNTASPFLQSWFVGRWANPDTADGTTVFGSVTVLYPPGGPHYYLKVVKQTVNNWDFYMNSDGGCWFTNETDVDMASFMTPTRVGFGLSSDDPAHVGCEWMRIRNIVT